MSEKKPILYTVGHSTHPISHFVKILKLNGVEAVADVRSSPFSKYSPQFNRDSLSTSLKKQGISYVFLGLELGARRDESECYFKNKIIYKNITTLPIFKRGISRLQEGAGKMKVAIMCSEKDPLTCHRTVLIAHYSRDFFSDVQHILEDGSIESMNEVDVRLLHECKLEKEDFFNTYEERLELAYINRAEKIAYEENQERVAYA